MTTITPRPDPEPGWTWVDVPRATWEVMSARNVRDTGRPASAPWHNPDGSVAFYLQDDTIAAVRRLAKPGETLADTILRALWVTKAKPEVAR
jgi:hypothetical protein